MGDGEVVFASKAFPCTAVLRVFERGGPGGRRRVGRRARAGAEGRLQRPPDHPARQRQVRARAARGGRGGRADRRRQLRRDRQAGAAGRAGRGDDPRHAGRRRRHARRDPDRPRGLEVRLLARRRAARDRAAARRLLGGPARPAHPHRLAALRPRAVAAGGRGDRHARRLRRVRPRRRARASRTRQIAARRPLPST